MIRTTVFLATSLLGAGCFDNGTPSSDGAASETAKPQRTALPYDLKNRVRVAWDQQQLASKHNGAGLKLHRKKQYEQAIALFEKAWETDPNHIYSRYNAACGHALLGRKAEALALLKEMAAMGGYVVQKQLVHAKTDSDFASLRDDPEFQGLLQVTEPAVVFPRGLHLHFASDPFDDVCLWHDYPDDNIGCPTTIHYIDCRTGQELDTRTSTSERECQWDKAAQREDGWLQTLGASFWTDLEGADKEKAEAWYARELADEILRTRDEETLWKTVVSPSGDFIAFGHSHMSSDLELDGHHGWTVRPTAEVLPGR